MTDLSVNIPEVVEEVRVLFERYEQALVDKDVDVLDDTFWRSPHTIRLALGEHGFGFDAIHAHRVARPPGPGTKERRLRLDILTFGRDFASVNLVFKVQTKAQVFAGFRSGDVRLERQDPRDLDVRIYGDTAIVGYRAESVTLDRGTRIEGTTRCTSAYVRRDGRWQLVLQHNTFIA